MAYDTGFSRRSASEREIQPVAIISVDAVSRTAIGATRTHHSIHINCAYATGDTITVPATGEKWYVERFDGEWRLYGRIPFNDATLNITPEEGQVSVGSAWGPLELNGPEVRFNSKVFRLNGVYYRDSGTSLERSTDQVTWTAVSAATATTLAQELAASLAGYQGDSQLGALSALKDWGGLVQTIVDNFTEFWNVLCQNVFVGGLKDLGFGDTDLSKIVDGFQNFLNYLFGVVFCDFNGDLTPQTVLARLRDLIAPLTTNPFITGLQKIAQILGVDVGNLLNDAVNGATSFLKVIFDIISCNFTDLAALLVPQGGMPPKIAQIIGSIGADFGPANIIAFLFDTFGFFADPTNPFGAFILGLQGFFSALFGTTGSLLKDVLSGVVKFFQILLGVILCNPDALAKAETIWGIVTASGFDFFNLPSDLSVLFQPDKIIGIFYQIFKPIIDLENGFLAPILNALKDFAQSMGHDVVSLLDGTMVGITELFRVVFGILTCGLSDTEWARLGGFLATATAGILPTDVIGFFFAVFNPLRDAVGNPIRIFLDSLQLIAEKLGNTVVGLLDGALIGAVELFNLLLGVIACQPAKLAQLGGLLTDPSVLGKLGLGGPLDALATLAGAISGLLVNPFIAIIQKIAQTLGFGTENLIAQILGGSSALVYSLLKIIITVFPLGLSTWQSLLWFVPDSVWAGVAAYNIDLSFLGNLDPLLIFLKPLEEYLGWAAGSAANFYANFLAVFNGMGFLDANFSVETAVQHLIHNILGIGDVNEFGQFVVATTASSLSGLADWITANVLNGVTPAQFLANLNAVFGSTNPLSATFNLATAATNFLSNIATQLQEWIKNNVFGGLASLSAWVTANLLGGQTTLSSWFTTNILGGLANLSAWIAANVLNGLTPTQFLANLTSLFGSTNPLSSAFAVGQAGSNFLTNISLQLLNWITTNVLNGITPTAFLNNLTTMFGSANPLAAGFNLTTAAQAFLTNIATQLNDWIKNNILNGLTPAQFLANLNSLFGSTNPLSATFSVATAATNFLANIATQLLNWIKNNVFGGIDPSTVFSNLQSFLGFNPLSSSITLNTVVSNFLQNVLKLTDSSGSILSTLIPNALGAVGDFFANIATFLGFDPRNYTTANFNLITVVPLFLNNIKDILTSWVNFFVLGGHGSIGAWAQANITVPIISQFLTGLNISPAKIGITSDSDWASVNLSKLGDIAGLLLTNLTQIPANLINGTLPPAVVGSVPVSNISNDTPNLITLGTFSESVSVEAADGWVWDSVQTATGSGGSTRVAITSAKNRYLYSRQAVPVVKGDRLVVSAAIKTSALTTSGGTTPISIAILPFAGGVQKTDGSGNPLVVTIGSAVGSNTTWTTIGNTTASPYTVTDATWTSVIVRLTVDSTATGGNVWWDDVSFKKTGGLIQGNVDSLNAAWNKVIGGLTNAPATTGLDWTSLYGAAYAARGVADSGYTYSTNTNSTLFNNPAGGSSFYSPGSLITSLAGVKADGTYTMTNLLYYLASQLSQNANVGGTVADVYNAASGAGTTLTTTVPTSAIRINNTNNTLFGAQAGGTVLTNLSTLISSLSTVKVDSSTAVTMATLLGYLAGGLSQNIYTGQTGTAVQSAATLAGSNAGGAKVNIDTVNTTLFGNAAGGSTVRVQVLPTADIGKALTTTGSGAMLIRTTTTVQSVGGQGLHIVPNSFFNTYSTKSADINIISGNTGLQVTLAGWYMVELAYKLNAVASWGWNFTPVLYVNGSPTKYGTDCMYTWAGVTSAGGQRQVQNSFIVYLAANGYVQAGYDVALGTYLNDNVLGGGTASQTYFSISLLNRSYA